MPLLKTTTHTIDDIYALPDGQRAELIDGQIYNMAPPSPLHQELVMELSASLRNYISLFYQVNLGGFLMMTVRNEIKAQIIRAGYTMQELVDRLHEEYGWSDSVSNLSAKLQRESIRYKEVMELADVLGYDLIWQKRR